MLFTYKGNCCGSRINPCGTPFLIVRDFNQEKSKRAVLSVKYRDLLSSGDVCLLSDRAKEYSNFFTFSNQHRSSISLLNPVSQLMSRQKK